MPRQTRVPVPLGPSLACGIGLLLAISSGFSSPEGEPVDGLAMRVWVPLPDWLVIGAVVAVSIASLTFIAIGLGWRRRRKNDDDGYEEHQEAEQIPILLKIAVILLALAPGAMMAGAIFWLSQSSLLPAPAGSVGGSRFEEHQAIDDAPLRPASSVTTGLIGALALLAGTGSLGVVLWLCFGDRLRRHRDELASGSRVQLAMAIEDSLDELRAELNARAAIIKIYGNFERALATAKLPRRPAQTPLEFMRAVLIKWPMPLSPVRKLTELFELARFSHHPVGAKERDSAWQSLLEIRTALEAREERPNAAGP